LHFFLARFHERITYTLATKIGGGVVGRLGLKWFDNSGLGRMNMANCRWNYGHFDASQFVLEND